MQDLSAKRKRLAENTVIQAGRLLEAVIALEALAAERPHVGNFTDEELADQSEGFDLRHLTPFLIAMSLETVVPYLTASLNASQAWGRARDLLIQLKR